MRVRLAASELLLALACNALTTAPASARAPANPAPSTPVREDEISLMLELFLLEQPERAVPRPAEAVEVAAPYNDDNG